MLAIDRWRKWRPLDEKFEEFPECEPSKPSEATFEGFEGPTSGQIQSFSDTPPDHDPAEWRVPIAQWLNSACVRHPRCFGGVGCLHIAFCEWESGRGGVPCTRATFERLLEGLDFLIGEVAGTVLVSGLTFRDDFEVVRL
jgi:hypothetical protein